MAFTVPQSKKSIKQNRFEFTIGDETFEIPLLQFAPLEAAEAFENDRPVTGILATCDTDAAREAVRKLDGAQLEALMQEWQKASEVTQGESPAS